MDIYEEPMVSVREAAQYLSIPESTMGAWKQNRSIHSVPAERHGWPTLPFAAVVEAFVLRALRNLNFTRRRSSRLLREFDGTSTMTSASYDRTSDMTVLRSSSRLAPISIGLRTVSRSSARPLRTSQDASNGRATTPNASSSSILGT